MILGILFESWRRPQCHQIFVNILAPFWDSPQPREKGPACPNGLARESLILDPWISCLAALLPYLPLLPCLPCPPCLPCVPCLPCCPAPLLRCLGPADERKWTSYPQWPRARKLKPCCLAALLSCCRALVICRCRVLLPCFSDMSMKGGRGYPTRSTLKGSADIIDDR